jgi:hypothetical protein
MSPKTTTASHTIIYERGDVQTANRVFPNECNCTGAVERERERESEKEQKEGLTFLDGKGLRREKVIRFLGSVLKPPIHIIPLRAAHCACVYGWGKESD